MPSRFFKHRLAAIPRMATAKAHLLLSSVTQTLEASFYANDPAKDTFAAIPLPALEGFIQEAKFSPDGKFLVTTTRYAPFVTLYRKEPSGYVKVPVSDLNATFVTSQPSECALSFSADGKLLCIGQVNKYFSIFQRSTDGTTYTHLYTTPGTAGTPVCAMSPSGTYIVTKGGTGGVNLQLWKRSGNVWNYLTTTNWNISSGSLNAVVWHPNDSHIFGAISNEYYALALYARNGDGISYVRSTSGPATARTIDISPDGKHIAIGATNYQSYFLGLWKYDYPSSTALTQLSLPTPPGGVNGVSFSRDGVYLAVGYAHSSTGAPTKKVSVYRRLGDSYTEVNTGIPNDSVFGGLRPYFGPVV